MEKVCRISKNKYVYDVICNTCERVIGTDPDTDGPVSDSHRAELGFYGAHECTSCKAARRRAYDNFVDPLNAYH